MSRVHRNLMSYLIDVPVGIERKEIKVYRFSVIKRKNIFVTE